MAEDGVRIVDQLTRAQCARILDTYQGIGFYDDDSLEELRDTIDEYLESGELTVEDIEEVTDEEM